MNNGQLLKTLTDDPVVVPIRVYNKPGTTDEQRQLRYLQGEISGCGPTGCVKDLPESFVCNKVEDDALSVIYLSAYWLPR